MQDTDESLAFLIESSTATSVMYDSFSDKELARSINLIEASDAQLLYVIRDSDTHPGPTPSSWVDLAEGFTSDSRPHL